MRGSEVFRSRMAFAGLVVLVTCFLLYHYGEVLLSPDALLFSDRGDGLKNYYTFLWQATDEGDPWAFSGMNHPYGEHVLFTDGHPLLAWCIRLADGVFPGTAVHAVGILNLILILSIGLSAVVLHFLLIELKVRPWLAAIGALGITVLAPQVGRLQGHMGLSYSVCLPLTWYLLWLVMVRQHSWRWAGMLLLSQLLWWGTHPYLGAMASLFGGGMALFLLVRDRRIAHMRKRALGVLIVGGILPILLFRLIVALTDTHSGRSDHPTGFFNYTAEPDDVLLPNAPPLRPVLDTLSNGAIGTQWEAQAYIGIGTIAVLLAWGIRSLRKHRTRTVPQPLPTLLTAGIWSSIALLLFAFCIPFKTFPGLLQWFPMFEQFRAIGRFTWPFYFTMTISAVYLMNAWIPGKVGSGRPGLAIALATLLPITWIIEGWSAHTSVAGTITPIGFASKSVKVLCQQLDRARYQAILPLPYFNFGSESFTRPSLDGITRAALPLSYDLRLPILGSILSRVSVPESRSLTQIVSPSWYPKPVAQLLEDDRDILIVRSAERLNAQEEAILSRAKPIVDIGGVRLYTITHDALFKNEAGVEIERFLAERTSLFERNGFLVSDRNKLFHLLDFDERPSPIARRGTGAFVVPKNGVHELALPRLMGIRKGDVLVLNAWFHNSAPESLNHGLRFEIIQGNEEDAVKTLPNEAQTIDEDWSLVELEVTALSDDPQLLVRTVCRGYLERTLIVDDLLIRAIGQHVYKVMEGTEDEPTSLFKDNEHIRFPR